MMTLGDRNLDIVAALFINSVMEPHCGRRLLLVFSRRFPVFVLLLFRLLLPKTFGSDRCL